MSQQGVEQNATQYQLSTEQLHIKVEPETHNDDTPQYVHDTRHMDTSPVTIILKKESGDESPVTTDDDPLHLVGSNEGSMLLKSKKSRQTHKQTREERLEKKRIAEKLRFERIRSDPILRAQLKEKVRERYLERKRQGIVKSIKEMSPHEQEIFRRKNRECSRKQYWKKKKEDLEDNQDTEGHTRSLRKNISSQTREERLEKKRIAERLRCERIKSDPNLRAQFKERERAKYLKKKRLGKIKPISEMSPREQEIYRRKSRESSRRHNLKKKIKNLEDSKDTEGDSTDNLDPLNLTNTSNIEIPEIALDQSTKSDNIPLEQSNIKTRSSRKASKSVEERIFKLTSELDDSDLDENHLKNARSPILNSTPEQIFKSNAESEDSNLDENHLKKPPEPSNIIDSARQLIFELYSESNYLHIKSERSNVNSSICPVRKRISKSNSELVSSDLDVTLNDRTQQKRKQTREERLEKKRIAERLRCERIKSDPNLRAQFKEREREKYLKKKRQGKIKPISEMSPHEQEIYRRKSRESSRKHNLKKKMENLDDRQDTARARRSNTKTISSRKARISAVKQISKLNTELSDSDLNETHLNTPEQLNIIDLARKQISELYSESNYTDLDVKSERANVNNIDPLNFTDFSKIPLNLNENNTKFPNPNRKITRSASKLMLNLNLEDDLDNHISDETIILPSHISSSENSIEIKITALPSNEAANSPLSTEKVPLSAKKSPFFAKSTLLVNGTPLSVNDSASLANDIPSMAKKTPSSAKKTWKYLYHRMKRRTDQQLLIKNKEIRELKQLNMHFRKQLLRLREEVTKLKTKKK